MKKLLCLPVVALLAFTVIACGKKSDDGAVAVVPAPVVVPPLPAPMPGTPDLSGWCYQQGGTYYSSQGICQIQQLIQNGWNINIGTINTGVPVYVNDRVTVSASGSPSAIVGSYNYGSGSFTSVSQGTLFIKGNGFDSFKIHSVQIARCYNSSGYGVLCP